MDFTVVTPSYNQGQFISENLNSVSAQHGVTLEHIVVDGGSCDETIDILSRHKSHHSFVWKSEKDDGQTDAINQGLERAEGEILCYLNSDDAFYSDHTLLQVKEAMEKTCADILYGNAMIVDERGAEIATLESQPFSFELLLKKNYIIQPSAFFKRTIVSDVGLFRRDLKYAMDLEYWLRCASKGKSFVYLDCSLSKFRQHKDSKTCSQTRFLIDEGYRTVRKEYFAKTPVKLWAFHKLAIAKFKLRNIRDKVNS